MFVTPLYAGLLALWLLALSVRVVRIRQRGIAFGDNGDVNVARVIRAQANFAEYVPLALLMMGFLEVSHFSIYLLQAFGITLLAARLVHGAALSFGWQPRFGRVTGATLTLIVTLIEGVLCVYQGLRGQSLWFH